MDGTNVEVKIDSASTTENMKMTFLSRKPHCRKLQIVFNLFLTVTWLCALIYYLLGQLLGSSPGLVRVHKQTNVLPPILDNFQPDISLMESLGFVPKPKLFPQPYHENQILPVFVMTLKQDDLYSFHRFLGSFRIHFPGKRLVVYNLGLDADELDFIRRTCQCLLREVQWDRYPSHIRDMTTKAYRPLLIQETLQEFGGVFWCHHAMRFNSSFVQYAEAYARYYGIAAWPAQEYPTSTFTHYHVFHSFNASKKDYYFQRMVEPDQALYFNIPLIHKKLMRNWLRCVLDVDCVSPLGAQAGGCKLTHRPKYVYAGCHRYDTSVFNVILGRIFNYDTPYISKPQSFRLEYMQPYQLPIRSWSLGKLRGS